MPRVADEILTTEDACRLLKMTRQTLYKLIESGTIQAKRVGRGYRFTKEGLLGTEGQKDVREGRRVWELRDNFAAAGIKKMAKRTFQELASNVEELIANAYDADATRVDVIVDQDAKTLSLIDDGNGMTTEELESTYVVYGASSKTSEYRSKKYGRAPIGEYGMGGKLAISNLSEVCRLVTRRDGYEHVFNMDSRQLDNAKYLSDITHQVVTSPCNASLHGTAVYMSNLRYRYVDTDRLVERLSMKMPCSQTFSIYVTIKENRESRKIEITEPRFETVREFKFEASLKYAGKVRLEVFFTKEPLAATKQGIWTKVNGRIVNERQEWFGLLNLHSGNRYRWRLYGYGYADGLKEVVTFSKNDFIDGPEYREYYDWVASKVKEVQEALLKADEAAARQKEKRLIKDIESKVNDWIRKLNEPEVQERLAAKIKEEALATAPEDMDGEETLELPLETPIGSAIDEMVERRNNENKARRSRRRIKDQFTYKGKGYRIETVDMSQAGDLVKFTKETSLVEINDKHPLYASASRTGALDVLVRDVALMEIARDISEDADRLELIYNQLARIAAQNTEVTQ